MHPFSLKKVENWPGHFAKSATATHVCRYMIIVASDAKKTKLFWLRLTDYYILSVCIYWENGL